MDLFSVGQDLGTESIVLALHRIKSDTKCSAVTIINDTGQRICSTGCPGNFPFILGLI